MVDVLIYPYESYDERIKIINENEGRYTNLGNCLVFYVNRNDEVPLWRLIKDYKKRIK
jgi:hypothetical protein